MGPKSANPASVPCHYAPVAPMALMPVNGQKSEIVGQIRTEKQLQRTPLWSPGDDISK